MHAHIGSGGLSCSEVDLPNASGLQGGPHQPRRRARAGRILPDVKVLHDRFRQTVHEQLPRSVGVTRNSGCRPHRSRSSNVHGIGIRRVNRNRIRRVDRTGCERGHGWQGLTQACQPTTASSVIVIKTGVCSSGWRNGRHRCGCWRSWNRRCPGIGLAGCHEIEIAGSRNWSNICEKRSLRCYQWRSRRRNARADQRG